MLWAGFGALALFAAAHVLDAYARSLGHPLPPALTFALLAVSVLAGTCLLVLGATLAVSREFRWWRLLAIPAIAIGLFWSVLPVALATVATRTVAPVTSELGSRYEEVPVPTQGAELTVSTALAPTAPPSSCCPVPARHGDRSSRMPSNSPSAATVSCLWTRVGRREQRQGDGLRLDGETDVRAVTDWLVAQPGVDGSRIGILGLSMGGEQALTAAANDSRLRAVVAEGASERSYEDVRRTLFGASVALGVLQYRALFGATELLGGVRPPEPLEDLVSRIGPRPVLLLNTAKEAHYGQRYAAASNGAATLWAPASQEHINALAEQPEEWETRIIDFLDEALLR